MQKVALLGQQMERNRPGKVIIPCKKSQKTIGNQSPSQSPGMRKRKNPAFITEKSQQGPYGKVHQYHNKLNEQIDVLDEKVQAVIDKHQGQFVLAYRNHVLKVRQEMEEIRKRATSNKDNSSSHFEKIENLQKQLSIFREESLSLFDKITTRQLQLERAKNRVAELQTEKKFNQQTIKSLMKRNKYLQGMALSSRGEKQTIPFKNTPSQVGINYGRTTSVAKNHPPQQLDYDFSRPYTTTIGVKTRGNSFRTRNQSIQLSNSAKEDGIGSRIRAILGNGNAQAADKIINLVNQNMNKIKLANNIVNQKRRNSAYLWKNIASKELQSIKSESIALKSQLQEFFYKCIVNVRKQIMRRKEVQSLNFYLGQQLNLEQFKKIDHFRLLQMVVSNERVIQGLYGIIFGERKMLSI